MKTVALLVLVVLQSGAAAPAFAEVASCYGRENGQTRTAQGKNYDPSKLTAAHRTLPFGTRLHVTRGGRSVTVTVNDRGPFVRGRDIDLSLGSCRALGFYGVEHVTIRKGDWGL